MTGVVLGICSYTHDSAAAAVIDGRLVGLAEEDRLLGEKHTRAFPRIAIGRLLAANDLEPGDVEAVGYNYAAGELFLGLVRALVNSRGLSAERRRARLRSWGALPMHHRRNLVSFGEAFPRAKVHGISHHKCHSVGAALSSGFDEAAVLSIDSIGEGRTTVISRWQHGRLQVLQSAWDTDSVGYVYGAITEHLGYRRGDEEGTVMALAALGDRRTYRGLATEAIVLTPRSFAVDRTCFPPRHFGQGPPRVGTRIAGLVPPRLPADELTEAHVDLAAAFQERTEDVVLHLARVARERTGSTRLVLTGGVALNCVANARVVRDAGFDVVYVPPSPGDAGTPLGAAALAWQRSAGVLPHVPPGEAMLGPAFSDGEALDAIETVGCSYRPATDPPSEIAARLAGGQIVGVFTGRAETGPRALGHRSILASPFVAEITDRLSRLVKRREPFRPFAPVVRIEDLDRFFVAPTPSPFMSFALEASPELRALAPAVVHIDGSARVQTVVDGQLLHAVLGRFEGTRRPPVIINTSLNQKGRPTSGTPAAAIECFVVGKLDALLLGNRWVER